jgi:hypothetical protein
MRSQQGQGGTLAAIVVSALRTRAAAVVTRGYSCDESILALNDAAALRRRSL